MHKRVQFTIYKLKPHYRHSLVILMQSQQDLITTSTISNSHGTTKNIIEFASIDEIRIFKSSKNLRNINNNKTFSPKFTIIQKKKKTHTSIQTRYLKVPKNENKN